MDTAEFVTDIVAVLASHRRLVQQQKAEERVKAETDRRQARAAAVTANLPIRRLSSSLAGQCRLMSDSESLRAEGIPRSDVS